MSDVGFTRRKAAYYERRAEVERAAARAAASERARHIHDELASMYGTLAASIAEGRVPL